MKLRDHVVKGSYDFKGRCFSQYVSMLTRLVTIGIVIYNIYCFSFVLSLHLSTYLNGYAILQLAALTIRHYAASFGGFRHCGSRDITYLICQVIHVATCLEDFATLWVKTSYSDSPPCQMLWPQTFRQQRYNVFNLSCDHM